MPGVQRVGDPNSGGGIAIGPGHNNVLINGRPALIPATPFTPHPPCSPKPWAFMHCIGVVAISGTSRSVFANGQPLVLDGGRDSCRMHSRTAGSADVRAI
jgi:uncharacterized Zn-binding protein involved in type VI secretion